MNRREFVQLMGLAYASYNLCSFSIPSGSRNKKVLIIGAGMAGAGAARMLYDQGFEIQIIEARNRIGGRMWSDNSLGTVLDMGAGWIEESRGNPINALAKQYGIKTTVSDFDSIDVYNSNGLGLNEDKYWEVYRKSQRILRRALRYGNAQQKDLSYQECLDHIWNKTSIDKELERMIKWRISTEEINAATSFKNLSAWGENEKGYSGDYLILPNGYAEIPQKMLHGIPIDYNRKVVEIIDHPNYVEVKTEQESYSGDYVIVTVPLGVLKQNKIKFTPDLSVSKYKAIKTLEMGNMNKLAIKYPEVFWGTEKHFLGCISKNYGEFPVFVNWAHYGNGVPYLLATVGSEFSEALYNKGEEEQLHMINKFMKVYFPNSPDATAVKFSGWKWQEFSCGSYSYLPVGAKEILRDSLAEPHKKIHFAGEATIRAYAGTVHGAFLSGQREANRILNY